MLGFLSLLKPTIPAPAHVIVARDLFVGDFPPVAPGDTRLFGVDFTLLLSPLDTVAEATPAVVSECNEDPNASAVLVGPCVILGNVVMQQLGGSPGFQPGAVYRWKTTVLTGFGETISVLACVPCFQPGF